jgi:hypothetical protein
MFPSTIFPLGLASSCFPYWAPLTKISLMSFMGEGTQCEWILFQLLIKVASKP